MAGHRPAGPVVPRPRSRMLDHRMLFSTSKNHYDLRQRVLLMGVLNVTPDSFSDGGAYAGVDDALAAARAMAEAGTDIIDVGGESTRPHADAVPVDEERRRVLPVVQAIARELDRKSVV